MRTRSSARTLSGRLKRDVSAEERAKARRDVIVFCEAAPPVRPTGKLVEQYDPGSPVRQRFVAGQCVSVQYPNLHPEEGQDRKYEEPIFEIWLLSDVISKQL